jgi:regulatory protein SWI6
MLDGTGSDLVATLRTHNGVVPSQKSQDIISNIVNLVQSLGTDFQKELAEKAETVDRTQTQLQGATKELSEQRKQLAFWKAQVEEREQLDQRIKNLERTLAEEHAFDWSGRTEINGAASADGAFNPYFGSNDPISLDPSARGDPPVPNINSPEALVRLRRLLAWYQRILALVRQRMDRTKGSSIELEARYRKLLAAFTGITEDQVDSMLGHLTQAVESDGNGVVRFHNPAVARLRFLAGLESCVQLFEQGQDGLNVRVDFRVVEGSLPV